MSGSRSPGELIEEIGLRPIINAGGTATRLGGQRLAPEVADAITAAAQVHLPPAELEEWAGRRIAAVTGAEAGYVTSGAAAGLVLAAAACVAGVDPDRIDRLPDTEGMPNEVIVQRGHRNAYDHAIRAVGVRIVEVGYEGFPGAGRTYGWQIEAAISERTAAIAHPVQPAPGTVPLAEVCAIARRRGVPVIVDAAGALPPTANLRRFTAEGADLVTFSGGKAIGGPQASGILCGRADLIRAVALQHQDMDVHPGVWRYRSMIEDGTIPGPPHHGIGRPMKVGKETIVGLVVALERFVRRDEVAEAAGQAAILELIAGSLDGLPGVSLELRLASPAGRPSYSSLVVDLGGPEATARACEVTLALEAGDPPIHVGQAYLDSGQISIIPTTLRPDEAEIVAERLRALLSADRPHP